MITDFFWEWDEEFNTSEYKLRTDINELASKGLINLSNPDQYFAGIRNSPSSIKVENNRIQAIYYKNPPFDFGISGIWDKEMKEIVPILETKLKKHEEEKDTPYIHVIFRDFFISSIGIKCPE